MKQYKHESWRDKEPNSAENKHKSREMNRGVSEQANMETLAAQNNKEEALKKAAQDDGIAIDVSAQDAFSIMLHMTEAHHFSIHIYSKTKLNIDDVQAVLNEKGVTPLLHDIFNDIRLGAIARKRRSVHS